ncbi:hypothetical protein N7G274_010370 [Stereocaulon virgatum]|uniref:non-specific serine/threonine protein kinase n=1 Tax=Stereocaulon virgatum TaxID=373712 RepID=A0ABR3ZW38_9LECA
MSDDNSIQSWDELSENMRHIIPDDDPNLIVRLVAAYGRRTPKMWSHSHNKSRYVPPSFQGFRQSSCIAMPDDTEAEIQLTFDKPPKDFSKGFVFGSDKHTCDVYCGAAEDGISKEMFRITFNDNGDIILQTMNQEKMTRVTYNNQEGGKRLNFTWILFLEANTVRVRVADRIEFDVIVSNHCRNMEQYEANRKPYLEAGHSTSSSLDQPQTTNITETSSTARVKEFNAAPYYYRRASEVLGYGTFGKVYVVIDVSSGKMHAAKEYLNWFGWGEVDKLMRFRHERIVEFIGTTSEDVPMLVMEYNTGGDLKKQRQELQFSKDEIGVILYQCLEGLCFLHAKKVLHRDIKPENILLAARYPIPQVRLADFGLAKECTYATSTCGTLMYAAPEVFTDRYTAKVDIWGLGVVIFECLMDCLPSSNLRHRKGPVWCEHIVEVAITYEKEFKPCEDCSLKELIEIVIHDMLQLDPNKRLSAEGCIEKAKMVRLRIEEMETSTQVDGIEGQQAQGCSMTRVL